MSSLDQIPGLFELARVAEAGTAHEEAYNYYSRILEISPGSVDAWLGKGRCAGWMSTLAQPRLRESISCFKAAEDRGLNELSLREIAANELCEIASALLATQIQHFNQFYSDSQTGRVLSYSREVDEMEKGMNHQLAVQFMANAMMLLEAVEYAHYLASSSIAKNTFIDVVDSLLNLGVLDSDSRSALLERRNYFVGLGGVGNELDFKPGGNTSSCFVVTACTDDANSEPVRILRRYRDEKLILSGTGRLAILTYSVIGPRLAALIRQSPILRSMMLRCVVIPAASRAATALDP